MRLPAWPPLLGGSHAEASNHPSPPILSPSAPSTSFTPTPLGADIGSDFHVVAVALPGTDCVEVRLLRRLHRRLARPGRLAEAAPRRYRRHGGHRRVLDCVVRPARSQGVPRFSWWTPARSNGPRSRPKSDTQDAQWIRRLHSLGLLSGAFRPDEGIRVGAQLPAPNAPGLVTECGRRPSSTCRRPWSRSTSN